MAIPTVPIADRASDEYLARFQQVTAITIWSLARAPSLTARRTVVQNMVLRIVPPWQLLLRRLFYAHVLSSVTAYLYTSAGDASQTLPLTFRSILNMQQWILVIDVIVADSIYLGHGGHGGSRR